MMPYSSNVQTPYVVVLSISIFIFYVSPLLFEYWDCVWQGPSIIQKILENFAMCGNSEIFSDLFEYIWIFLFHSSLLQLLLNPQIMLKMLNEMMSESLNKFTLNLVSQDKDSRSKEIWSDYIQFLHSREVWPLVSSIFQPI